MQFVAANKLQNIFSALSGFHSPQLVTSFQKNVLALVLSGSRNTEKLLKKSLIYGMTNCFLFSTFVSLLRHENI